MKYKAAFMDSLDKIDTLKGRVEHLDQLLETLDGNFAHVLELQADYVGELNYAVAMYEEAYRQVSLFKWVGMPLMLIAGAGLAWAYSQ